MSNPLAATLPAIVKGNALAGVRCNIEPGSGNYHFSMRCDDCDVRALLSTPLGQVEDQYREGRVRQAVYEAFTFVWATDAPRFATYHAWTVPPTDPEVIALVELFRKTRADLPGGDTRG